MHKRLTWNGIVMSATALVLTSASALTAQAGAKEVHNKNSVREFYELAFNQHKPTEAAKKYIGDKYIQHNPHVPNGAAAFYNYFEGYFKDHPKAHVEIKRVLGDGDLVALHLNSKMDTQGLGVAVIDIFRLENGKIVEHWDVVQPVPEKSANSNTMF